jgi:site-specific DNA-methyltransferase (adenine-specific)
MSELADQSIHLVVTSPPYWTLKRYVDAPGQLGHLDDYEQFLDELDKVWAECYRVLVPGGRLCCVVGDICISRRQGGRHRVMPLPSDIQVRARRIGYDNLTPIMWFKVGNIKLEASKSSVFLGKPNLPNGIIKNDRETILMLRKPGGYRRPTPEMEEASRISTEDYTRWFHPIWTDIPGTSSRDHPAPFPIALAERLIRMFSFVGDTLLDPFLGTGTTTAAAISTSRNSAGYEISHQYVTLAYSNALRASSGQTATIQVSVGTQLAPTLDANQSCRRGDNPESTQSDYWHQPEADPRIAACYHRSAPSS